MGTLRIRLRIQNCPPCSNLKSWYLLNQCEFRDVGAFLIDVKEKFCIRVDKLRCRINGFFLPSWENIGIIRDEDEIVIEKDEGIEYFSSATPLHYDNYDERIGCNSRDDSGELVGQIKELSSSSNRNSELPSFVNKISEKIRHKKKRKLDIANEEKDNEEVNKSSLGNGVKEKKKKKKRKVIELNNESPEKKQNAERKGKGRFINDTHIGIKSVGLGEEDPCKDTYKSFIAQGKEVLENKRHCKDKKDASISSDKSITASNLKETKVAVAKNKQKKNNNANDRIPKQVENDGGKGLETNFDKSAVQSQKDNSKKKNDEKLKINERSFQLLSRSVQYNGRNSSQISVKSNLSGSHVYFDSDDDDDIPFLKHENISGVPNNTSSDLMSISTFEDSSPAVTCKTRKLLGPKDDYVYKSAISKAHLKQDILVNHAEGTTDAGKYCVLSEKPSDQNHLSLLEQSGKSDKVMETHNVQDRNYDVLPALQGAPRVGDKIAFKVLEMSLSYTPEISDYKEGVVKEVCNKGIVTISLTDHSKGRKVGDGTLTRKFELESDSEHEDNDTLEIYWKEFIDPRLLSG